MAVTDVEDGPWAGLLEDEPFPVDLPPLPPDPLEGVPGPEVTWPVDEGLGETDVEGPGSPQVSGEQLARILPGLGLAGLLEGLDPAAAGEYELVEMVAGYQRVASWAQSQMTQLAGVLSRRPVLNPQSGRPGGVSRLNVTAEELAPRLGISRMAARRMVELARVSQVMLEDTAVALHQGRIDYPKACVLLRMLADQPGDVAWEVQQQVLPGASHQTVTQLERAVARAIIAVDPARAAARARRARESRRVGRPRVLPDGMASMFAVLPATDAAGLDLALEAAARAAKAAGDTRTVDQLRADALALLGHGALERGFIGIQPEAAGTEAADEGSGTEAAGTEAGGAEAADGGVGVRCEVAVADERVGEAPAAEGGVAGAGGPDATASDGATGQGPVEVPPEEPVATAGPETPPGQDDTLRSEGDPEEPAPRFQTGNSFLRTPCMRLGAIGGRRAQVHVTIPLSVLLPPEALRHPPDAAGEGAGDSCAHAPDEDAGDGGRGCAYCRDGLPGDWYAGPTPAEVAELEGYGPITPDVARALAYSATTWFRLITDPLSGRLLDVGRTRYRPPAAMAHFVRLRDTTCVNPVCPAAARSCELDHVVPWQFGGVTSADNLAPQCGRDHRVKSTGAFGLQHEGGGTFVWTTPSGHRYRRDHTGRITQLDRAAIGAGAGFAEYPPF